MAQDQEGRTSSTPEKPRLFGLTADEWLDLASSEDAEVGPCCGNIGALREYLQMLAGYQDETLARMTADDIVEAYEMAVPGHEPLADPGKFPLLHRVLAAVGALRSSAVHRLPDGGYQPEGDAS